MTRKHFIQIAEILLNNGGWYPTPEFKDLVSALADYFQKENPNFDRV